jgi:indolepyruvate ferredoxin oxidoreductase
MQRAFGVLAKFKGLRGTAFDVFGYTAERRTERALIAEYRALVDELLDALTLERLADAVALAALPEEIRGYGHVKERNLEKVRAKWAALLAEWRAGDRAGAKAA